MNAPAFYSSGSWQPFSGQEERLLEARHVDELAPTEPVVVARVVAGS
jgi:hypothetical protein